MRISFLNIVAPVFLSLLVVFPASADFQAGSDALNRKDYAAALAEFQPLAEQGDPEGQYGMGILYGKGLGVPESDPISMQWHTRAAEQGHAGAQLQLGIMYGNGYGVPENDQTSFKWYMLAAKQENPEAMWNVGIYYEQGLSVATDVDTARMWYLRAANVGFPGAPYSLGRMSALGIATPKDEIEAYKWFLIGALLKEPYATAAFKSLGPTMTNADVKQGVERADEFGKAIEKRLEDRRAAEESERTTTPAASHGGTLEDKLRKLKKLEEAGLITKEEAAKKRGELLDNL